jgi:hypothetical protein
MVREGLLEEHFLGIVAFPTGSPSFKRWWEWVLIAVVGVSVVVGSFACFWYSYRSLRRVLSVRTHPVFETFVLTMYLCRSATTYTPSHDLSKNVFTFSLEARRKPAASTYLPSSRPLLASTSVRSVAPLQNKRLGYCHNGMLSCSTTPSPGS